VYKRERNGLVRYIAQLKVQDGSGFFRRNKSFENEIEAAKWYDVQALELYGEYAYLNFDDRIVLTPAVPTLRVVQPRPDFQSATSSKYRGVSKCDIRGKWCASIYFNNKSHNLGRHLTEEKAAQAVNYAILQNNLNRPLNDV